MRAIDENLNTPAPPRVPFARDRLSLAPADPRALTHSAPALSPITASDRTFNMAMVASPI